MQRAFAAVASAWALALPAAAYVASQPHPAAASYAFAFGVYGLGSVVCHQLPARSFHMLGVALPVCARCTGIYLGAAAMAIATTAARLKPRPTDDTTDQAPDIRDASVASVGHRFSGAVGFRLALAVAALPSAATLVFEWTTGVMPANWIRFAAGVPIGVAVAWLVRAAAENQVN